jgi:hypothetical protein
MNSAAFFALCAVGASITFGVVVGVPFNFSGKTSYAGSANVGEFAKSHSGEVRKMAGICLQPYTSKTLVINFVGDGIYRAFHQSKANDSLYTVIGAAQNLAVQQFEKEISRSADRIETLKKNFEKSRTISVYADPNDRTRSTVPESFRKEFTAAGLPGYPSISESDANKRYADYGQIRNFRNARSDLEEAENYRSSMQSLYSSISWSFSGIANCTIEKLGTLASEQAKLKVN